MSKSIFEHRILMLGFECKVVPIYRAIAAWFFIGVSLMSAGCHREAASEPPPAVRPVLSMMATPQSGPVDGYSGTIEPRYQTDLGFRILGRIVARDVSVSDSVMVGQRLAALDPEVLETAVRSAEAVLSNEVAQRANSESNLKRQTMLLAQNATPQAEVDLATKANEVAVAAVVQAQSDLDKANEELSYAELKSDLDGVVTNIFAETGQTVTAGQKVVSIANPNLREAVVDIGEDVVSTIHPETEFRVTLQVSPDIETTGIVREVAPQADAKTRTRRVRIAITDPPEGFRLGATITAFPKSRLQPNIHVPRTAVLESDGATFVWLVDEANKRVNRVPVTIVDRHDQSVEVVAGIQAGDRVVTAGVHSLQDGQPIRCNPGDLP